MFKSYYRLTKPGIIYGNLLTALGGFFLASKGDIDPIILLGTAVGTALIIGSACVLNNYFDRAIDARMSRTSRRALVSGEIRPAHAVIFGITIGISGTIVLYTLTNLITLSLGLIGFVSYVFLYTFLKRKTVHGTLIGSIPGATPVAAGYTAVTGNFDIGALILFIILVIWQMPHFYAIAIFRKNDYAAAKIPVLSVVKGTAAAKKQIVLYIYGLVFAVFGLWAYGYAGYTYLLVMTAYTLYWLSKGLRGLRLQQEDIAWSRMMFGLSLLFLLIFSVLLTFDAWLP